MIKAIIFDFFGVIYADPYEYWLNNHEHIRDGEYLEASQQFDMGHIDSDTFFRRLSEISHQPEEAIRDEFDLAGEVNYSTLKIMSELKTKYKICVLTNASSEYINKIITNNDIDKYFDEIIISSEVGYIKPDREIFDITLSRLNIHASEALLIDDNDGNIIAAKKYGINAAKYENVDQLRKNLSELLV